MSGLFIYLFQRVARVIGILYRHCSVNSFSGRWFESGAKDSSER